MFCGQHVLKHISDIFSFYYKCIFGLDIFLFWTTQLVVWSGRHIFVGLHALVIISALLILRIGYNV